MVLGRGCAAAGLRGFGTDFSSAPWFYLPRRVRFLWGAIGRVERERGILPAAEFFRRAREFLGTDAYWQFPSVCWLGADDNALYGWCVAGILASTVLICGFAPLPCLVFLWVDYLSLTVAGQVFYQFQWDILLLEAGFFGIFLSPWKLRLARAGNPPRPARFLLIWLLFRLVFASAVVKLSSGDPAWLDATALSYHYFTQPLPTPVAWFAQQLPGWWQVMSVRVMFFIELALPFFLFAPRHPRLLAAGGIVALQFLIALTGNYGFFNLLTVALCLLAVDDVVWGKVTRGRCGVELAHSKPGHFLSKKFSLAVAVAVFLLSLVPLAASFRRPVPLLSPLIAAYEAIAPFARSTATGFSL